MNHLAENNLSYEQATTHLAAQNSLFPLHLVRMPIPGLMPPGEELAELWRSRDFLVQVYMPRGGGQQVSVNRTAITRDGEWVAAIRWDDLQQIKREIGRGEQQAVELYPADTNVVNIANIRHIWLLDAPLPFEWRKHG